MKRASIVLALLWAMAAWGETHQTGSELGDGLRVEELAPGVWRHVSLRDLGDGPIPANGLVFETGEGALIVDTPWTDAQTERLLDWLKERGHPGRWVVPTHFHGDCLGGLAAAHAAGLESHGSTLTAKLAEDEGYELPRELFDEVRSLTLGGERIELFHPGAGHSPDNIVVWIESRKVLFGGCLVKSASSGKGYLGVADLRAWPESMKRVIERYPEVEVVVPGHGAPGGGELLTHTRELAEAWRDEETTE